MKITDIITESQSTKAQPGVAEHIVKVKGGYELRSKHGNKNLGKYPTRAGAEKRERQVQYFKHAKEGVAEGDMAPVHVSGKELPGAVERLERVLLNAKQQGKKLDYDHIDLIMQKICQKHNLTGDKLHDDFVSKHHRVPDNWIKKQEVEEGWSNKYKRSIDCSHPKGFSQKAHCAGKKKRS